MASSSQPSHVIHHRNVVVVGKSGSGKSSVANNIAGQDLFKIGHTTESETTRQTHVAVDFRYDNVIYSLKIVDTVGLFDTERGKAGNQAIMDEIKRYFTEKFPEGINLVLFVFKKGNFSEEEKETFAFIISEFKKSVSAMSALVITHCDGMEDDEREDCIRDFRTAKVSCDIAGFMQKGIYTVGFPDWFTCSETKKEKLFRFTNIQEDSDTLRALIINSSEMSLGKQMFEQVIEEVKKKIDKPGWKLTCQIL